MSTLRGYRQWIPRASSLAPLEQWSTPVTISGPAAVRLGTAAHRNPPLRSFAGVTTLAEPAVWLCGPTDQTLDAMPHQLSSLQCNSGLTRLPHESQSRRAGK
jgi:hypothetical protein